MFLSLALPILFWYFIGITALCHNNCNSNGICSKWGTCECWEGWEGNACEKRSCSSGIQLSSIPYASNQAHSRKTCSGQGECDHTSGTCKCNNGYAGIDCSRTLCFNDCSGRGSCISLRTAAVDNDGYFLNRTSTYNLWDADVIFGCQCDFGWSGPDCSERSCPSGPDPRLSSSSREQVKLVCQCDSECSGRFKLRYKGITTRKWLYPTSRAFEVADSIMAIPGVYSNNSAQTFIPIVAINATVDDLICKAASTTVTNIQFRRDAGDLPSLSFYGKRIVGGQIFFRTEQNLQCDCINHMCNGTFRLSFDGEMSSKLLSYSDISEVTSALRTISTIRRNAVSVATLDTGKVCEEGAYTNKSIIFEADFGNVPRLGLWNSIVGARNPFYYSTENSSNVLQLTTSDGRDDSVKLCNGIGKCNFFTGECTCPYGWGYDGDLGPCARLVVNTSEWNGLARCPGVVSVGEDFTGDKIDQQSRGNYDNRVYASANPSIDVEGVSTQTPSFIFYIKWDPSILLLLPDDSERLFDLTSNSSAGPLVVDQATDRLFFVDANPENSFIGVFSLAEQNSNYSVWLTYSYKIFGLAMDAHFDRRKLYWSVPGIDTVADGSILWAYLDDAAPVVNSLVAAIGQSFLVDPRGIAVHYIQERIYWIDRNLSAVASVLRSSKFDGTGYQEVSLFRQIDNHTVSTNLTDLTINFNENNTAFFLDTAHPAALLATNLDYTENFNNNSNVYKQFEQFYEYRVICSTFQETMGSPQYLVTDEWSKLLLWSDPSLKQVGVARYVTRDFDVTAPNVAYSAPLEFGISGVPHYIVGFTFDRGYGPPRWGAYLDCYGNGRCAGLTGNFECICDKGYFGDCQARMCPTGRAWWHEPVADNIAHDEYVECSNMGTCDRSTGQCTCRPGYEGTACERLSCAGESSISSECNNRGRCLPLKDLGKKHKNSFLEPDPVIYGSSPIAATTWDANMIHGCSADTYGFINSGVDNITEFIGSALDELDCPVAYNTRLTDIVYTKSNYTVNREIQRVKCRATDGYFLVQFRGMLSQPIHRNASSTEVKNILQNVPTIGQVVVDFAEDTVCGRGSFHYANVTFLSQVGKIPLLILDKSNLGGYRYGLTVERLNSVSSTPLECGGYGSCDKKTGQCNCWKYRSTSDGYGNAGNFGDCGHYLLQ